MVTLTLTSLFGSNKSQRKVVSRVSWKKLVALGILLFFCLSMFVGLVKILTVKATGVTADGTGASGDWVSGASFAVSLSSYPLTIGETLIFCASLSGGCSVINVTETGVNWIILSQAYFDEGNTIMCIGHILSSASTTATIYLSGSVGDGHAQINEFSANLILDQDNVNQSRVSTTALDVSTVSSTQYASEVCVACVSAQYSGTLSSPLNGFTASYSSTNGGNNNFAYLYNIVSSVGIISAGVTSAYIPNSAWWSAAVYTFYAVGQGVKDGDGDSFLWSSGQSFSGTLTGYPMTSGETLVADITLWGGDYSNPSAVSSISQQGVTWTLAVTNYLGGAQGVNMAIYYGQISSGASSIMTINLSGTLSYVCAQVTEYSEALTLDQTAINDSRASTTILTTGITSQTTKPNEVIVGMIAAQYPYGFTPMNCTMYQIISPDGSIYSAYLDTQVSAENTYSTGVISGGSPDSGWWGGAIATFLEPSLGSFTISVPSSEPSGTLFGGVTVTAYTNNGQIFAGYTGNVYFTSTDGQAVLPYTSGSKYTFTANDGGTHTFSNFVLKTAGSQTITVTDSSASISQISTSISVTIPPSSMLVQNATASFHGTTTGTLTFSSQPLQGDSIILGITVKDLANGNILGSLVTPGVTWSSAEVYRNSNYGLYVAVWQGYVNSPVLTTENTSITLTDYSFNGASSSTCVIWACEWACLLNPSLDLTAYNSGTSYVSDASTSPSQTSQPNELIVAASAANLCSQSTPIVNSFSQLGGSVVNSAVSLSYLYQTVSTTQIASTGDQLANGNQWVICLASFKIAPLSVITVTPSNVLLGQSALLSFSWAALNGGTEIIPSWNNTGSFVNQTTISISGVESSSAFSGTWTAVANSKVTIIFYIEDSTNAWASNTFTFTLVAPNTTPIYQAGSAWTIGQFSNGTYYSYNNVVCYTDQNYISTLMTNAITSTSSGGGSVYVETPYLYTSEYGSYLLNQPIVPASNVTLTCAPNVLFYETQPATLSTSFSLMVASGTLNNFTLNGGTWNSNKGSLSDHRGTGTWNSGFAGYMGINIGSGANCTVENAVIENCVNSGLTTYESYNCQFLNDQVLGCGDNPITFNGNVNGSPNGGDWDDLCNGCTVVGGQDVGINTFWCDNCTLSNNNVSDILQYTGASNFGMAFENSFNNYMINNTISHCAYDLIDISVGSQIIGNTVSNAIIGIQTQTTGMDNSLVKDNVFGSGLSYRTYDYYGGVENVTLQGNIGLGTAGSNDFAWQTLNVTASNAVVSESNDWCNQNLPSINGNNYQFLTGSNTTLTAAPSAGYTFGSFTFTNGTVNISNPMNLFMNGNYSVSLVLTNSNPSPSPSPSGSGSSSAGSVPLTVVPTPSVAPITISHSNLTLIEVTVVAVIIVAVAAVFVRKKR